MKRFLILLALAGVLFAQGPKAYEGVMVTVSESSTNSKKVRLITAASDKFHFLFTCNVDEETCAAPQLKTPYRLYTHPEPRIYQCDEYGMAKTGGWRTFIVVCLQDVTAR